MREAETTTDQNSKDQAKPFLVLFKNASFSFKKIAVMLPRPSFYLETHLDISLGDMSYPEFIFINGLLQISFKLNYSEIIFICRLNSPLFRHVL